ncbi:MAG: acetyl-CoA carboxylase biotin carboxylase subunit [Bacteroidetes bacterium]|nr:acetyl-CoA carboxylase biotin carboxylase subunit [Bacteroidota bacterium]
MFKKILVANRGEIALRIIRTCKEMNIKTVAVYSSADADSLHVKFADEAVCIGPPASKDSYLNIQKIMAAVEITNADAIHPGYGFLSENPTFPEICAKYKIKFIGPSAKTMREMGDKTNAKQTMKRIGVPVIPGSDGNLKDIQDAKKVINKIGYPAIIKATAGGGGKGMRIIRNEEEIENAYDTAKQEAKASFSSDELYVEKYIENPHHIEIQIAGDQYGKACHLSERDCSIQRRHQKLLEESPSPFMTDKLRDKMGKVAIKIAKAIKYEGVGTIEFLVDKKRNFYFMEMNTRIQVEHTITEEVIFYDLVKEQIKIAAGEKIKNTAYFPRMHAIQCRINAEDPFKNFMPCPGVITNLHTPGGHGIRVDSHIYAGYTVPIYYDSLISKVIAVAQTRAEAIETMQRALSEYVIDGIKTTIPFHQQLLADENFQSGNITTAFLDSFELKKREPAED